MCKMTLFQALTISKCLACNDMLYFDFCRYYNSWIEITDDAALSETSSSFSGTPKLSESEKKVSLPQDFKKNSLDLTDDIEKFAPQVAEASVDFSISYEVNFMFLYEPGHPTEECLNLSWLFSHGGF